MHIKNRIVELRMVKAKDLVPNPKNWRLHPQEQSDAMAGILRGVGFAGATLAYETSEGLKLIDGHMRREVSEPDQEIPVLVLDVNDEEADKILATYDPLSAMATTDDKQLATLLDSVETDNEALQAMLDDMKGELSTEEETQLVSLDIKMPPKMAWVLIGIPLVHYNQINQDIERIASLPNVIMEMTANDNQIQEDRQPQSKDQARPTEALPRKVSRRTKAKSV